MAFTPIALGTATLGATAQLGFDHVSIPLTPTPDAAWIARFNAYGFAPPMLQLQPGINARPRTDGVTVEFDLYAPAAASRVAEIKAAVADANGWYSGPYTTQQTATAAAASAEATARTSRQSAFNTLLAAP